jgi:hypothetical protein
MNVGTVRTVVGFSARRARDPAYYTPLRVDAAVAMAANELIRRAKLLPRVDQLTLTGGSSALPAFPTGSGGTAFRPDRLIKAYLSGAGVVVNQAGALAASAPYNTVGALDSSWVGPPRSSKLIVPDFITLNDQQIAQPMNGQPQMMAFNSVTTGQVYPTPVTGQNYTLNFCWSDFLTVWTWGATDNTTLNTVLNLPDDQLYPVLEFGAPYYLQYTEPESKFAPLARQKFDDAIAELSGLNSLGAEVMISDSSGGY